MHILKGRWKLATDPGNAGRDEGWFERIRRNAVDAPVPGVIQQAFPGYHGVAWYWHRFRLEARPSPDDRVLIRFGAVDYLADVWLNGTHLGAYEGGETPFEFDITREVKRKGDNLLAVRVLNPIDDPIDGYTLAQTPHRNKKVSLLTGSFFDCGGIMYPVEIHFVPSVHVTDIFARPDVESGTITVTATVRNSRRTTASGRIVLSAAPACGGDAMATVEKKGTFRPGTSRRTFTVKVPHPHLWDLDDPFLYRVTVEVTAGRRAHAHSVRCGFRDFRVVDGYFHLNGKRIFLKSTHTGNAMPIGQQVAVIPDHVRRDMIHAKASGFNTVRFIAGVGYPTQLDFCDEIGLMVYEECLAAWCLGESPKMGERFNRSTSAMIRRDRNHPSVTIWGLLNETLDGPVFQRAHDFLPVLRKLDDSRLVLLNSGRFDNRFDIGTISNPRSGSWEHVWGIEGPSAPTFDAKLPYPSRDGAGDFHFYPSVPQTQEATALIRNLGRGTKPVFLSEYGIGSLFDVIREWRHFQQAGARPDLEDGAWLKEQSEALMADWKRLGFDDVYPFPEDLLRESQRLHARQRTIGFDAIRSNPNICGYNLTGMLDHAMTGEGLWTYWREWKPATFDAVTDGWSPLRWCLFVDPLHAYSGRTVTVEAVLATEAVLKPGKYPARFRVVGPDGPVWEKSATISIPDPAPLAVPAIKETFRLKGPAGNYTFSAVLRRGGAPTGEPLTFHVSESRALPGLTGSAAVWGIGGKVRTWLERRGLSCRDITAPNARRCSVILAGNPKDADSSPSMWAQLSRRLAKGATVIFLDSHIFAKGKAAMEWLPLKKKGTCRTFHDWLYHKECVSKRHPVFDGLQGPGIMDWDYYGPVIPHDVFEGFETPDETIAAAFATGFHQYPRGYGSGLLIAAYRSGKGRIVLSTPYLLENVGTHPAADRMLTNLIRYTQEQKRRICVQPRERRDG